MKRFFGLSICAALAWGCGDDDPPCDGMLVDFPGLGTVCVPNDAGGLDGSADVITFDVADAGPLPDTGGIDGDTPDGGDVDSGTPGTCDEATAGYGPCTPDRGCPLAGQECIAEIGTTLGGAADPIMDAPDGVDPIPTTIFGDGLCSPAVVTTIGTIGACDPDDDESTVCGDCGSCENLGGVSACLPVCEPSLTDNGGCRDGAFCSLTDGVCFPFGCGSDDECRVAREDNNGIPGLQTQQLCMASPEQCGGDATNFDALVYDTESTATCNLETFECDDQPTNPAASGGDMCMTDRDCEDGGRCIQEGGSCSTNADVDCVTDAQCTAAITGAAADGVCDSAWSGGACIKLGCDFPGNECANDGVCQERGLGVALCLAGCTIGDGADAADPDTWVDPATAAGGCRDGYLCFWNGVGGRGVANNGVCVPGDFQDVAENVGEVCDSDADCYGPFGQQRCIDLDGADGPAPSVCTVNDCTAPYFAAGSDANICGDGNVCADFGSAGDPFGLCLGGCETGADCEGAGIGCIDQMTLFGAGTGGVCFPGCLEAADCQPGNTCEGATAMALGECVPE